MLLLLILIIYIFKGNFSLVKITLLPLKLISEIAVLYFQVLCKVLAFIWIFSYFSSSLFCALAKGSIKLAVAYYDETISMTIGD